MTKTELRLQQVPAISRLTRSQTFRAAMPTAREPAGLFVIPVLPDDTVAYILDRLSEATGTAVLVLTTAGGAQRIVSLVDRSDLAGGAA